MRVRPCRHRGVREQTRPQQESTPGRGVDAAEPGLRRPLRHRAGQIEAPGHRGTEDRHDRRPADLQMSREEPPAMTLRSVPASGATLDPSILISTRHFGDEVGGMVAVTLYGLVLDCQGCRQPTTALLAFVPNGDPAWDRRWVVLCNTEASLAVADAALPEITHIVNAVGRPDYDGNQLPALTNACFH